MHCPVKEYRLLASCTRSNFTVIVAVLSGKLTVMGEVTTTSDSRDSNIKGKKYVTDGAREFVPAFSHNNGYKRYKGC